MLHEEDKAPLPKTEMERHKFDELEEGLWKIFRNSIHWLDKGDSDAEERIAGAQAAQAILTLQRDFEPK